MEMSTKGINKYDDKERRKVRRRNHIAKDLADPKFRPRIIDPRADEDWQWEVDEYFESKE
jgi:hypothetical protein